jgi:hypothetical protein
MIVKALQFEDYYRMQRLQSEIAQAEETLRESHAELLRRKDELIETYVGDGDVIGFSDDFAYLVYTPAKDSTAEPAEVPAGLVPPMEAA